MPWIWRVVFQPYSRWVLFTIGKYRFLGNVIIKLTRSVISDIFLSLRICETRANEVNVLVCRYSTCITHQNYILSRFKCYIVYLLYACSLWVIFITLFTLVLSALTFSFLNSYAFVCLCFDGQIRCILTVKKFGTRIKQGSMSNAACCWDIVTVFDFFESENARQVGNACI